jgi:hypothetical protein
VKRARLNGCQWWRCDKWVSRAKGEQPGERYYNVLPEDRNFPPICEAVGEKLRSTATTPGTNLPASWCLRRAVWSAGNESRFHLIKGFCARGKNFLYRFDIVTYSAPL